jgi:hypothetical protein
MWGMKRLLGSVLLGCSLAFLPLLMGRVFPGALPLLLVRLLFIVWLPGVWVSFLTTGLNGDAMNFALALTVVASGAFYTAAVFALSRRVAL